MRTRGERIIAFIEQYCIVPEGDLVGQPVRLEQFQKDFILAVYDNKVPTSLGILSISRKNGKSGLITYILLAHIAGPEAVRNSQINSGAMAKEQAAIVFEYAVKVIEQSPALAERIRLVPSQKKLVGLAKNVTFMALASDGKNSQGKSPILVILDEVGQVRGPRNEFFESLMSAQGAYANALVLIISTQAASDADMLSIFIDTADQDPSIVCHVYAADEDCDLGDRKQWFKANPALGKFNSIRNVESQYLKAVNMPALEAEFRNKHLNQRIETINPLITKKQWKANGGAPDDDVFKRCEVFGGLDLSKRTDLTALVLVARDENGIWHWRTYAWTPEQGLRDRAKVDKAPYDVWVDEGHLLTTPGATVDYDLIALELIEISGSVNWAKCGFDPWRIDVLVKALENADAPDALIESFVKVKQTSEAMSPGIEAMLAELANGRVRHGNHPVLSQCVANTRLVNKVQGAFRFEKARETGRIDAAVAAAIAMAVGAREEAVDEPEMFVESWD